MEKNFSCSVCGKIIDGIKGKKYCSQQCKNSARNVIRVQKRKEVTEKKICQVCGNKLKSHMVKYCSKTCYKKQMSDMSKKRYSESTVERFKSKPCLICGNMFIPIYGAEKTCSDECRNRRISNQNIERVKVDSSMQYIDGQPPIDVKCPCCGRIRKYFFVYSWTGNGMPRIKCDDWPSCGNVGRSMDCDDSYIPLVYESENRSMV